MGDTSKSVKVGYSASHPASCLSHPDEIRMVSELNHKLFTAFMSIADEEKGTVGEHYPGGCSHMGKWHVGQFITWLEDNYELKEK
jgi:hypothetical protein